MSVIYVGGTHGVGKSTLIKRAVELAKIDVPILKGSRILADFLGISQEELPYISIEDRQRGQDYMYRILNQTRNGVRDSHFSVYTPQGFISLYNDLDVGNVKCLVLVFASVDQIFERRKSRLKKRPLDKSQIAQHLLIERNTALAFANSLNAQMFEIDNSGEIDVAAIKLAELIKVFCI